MVAQVMTARQGATDGRLAFLPQGYPLWGVSLSQARDEELGRKVWSPNQDVPQRVIGWEIFVSAQLPYRPGELAAVPPVPIFHDDGTSSTPFVVGESVGEVIREMIKKVADLEQVPQEEIAEQMRDLTNSWLGIGS